MADGRDHQAMQKKFQDMVGNLDQLDEQLIQKPYDDAAVGAVHTAADSCVEKCIGTDISNSEMVNTCMQRCDRALPFLDKTVQQELTNLQGRMQLCALDCSEKMADSVPPGTKDGDPALAQGVMQTIECTANCATKSVGLVSEMLAKVEAAADLASQAK